MNIEKVSASEFLLMLADAMAATNKAKYTVCTSPDCENPIRKGKRCGACQIKRKQEADRIYDAKQQRQRDKRPVDTTDNSTKSHERPA